MALSTVYLSLGANLGEPLVTLSEVLEEISMHSEILSLESSEFYTTTPVSSIPQPLFINVVCRFETRYSVELLFSYLSEIEKKYGKVAKNKDEPRCIDIDILFFGHSYLHTEILTIPHPRWHERLFVLKPLLDLTKVIEVPLDEWGKVEVVDLEQKLIDFPNVFNEEVSAIP